MTEFTKIQVLSNFGLVSWLELILFYFGLLPNTPKLIKWVKEGFWESVETFENSFPTFESFDPSSQFKSDLFVTFRDSNICNLQISFIVKFDAIRRYKTFSEPSKILNVLWFSFFWFISSHKILILSIYH